MSRSHHVVPDEIVFGESVPATALRMTRREIDKHFAELYTKRLESIERLLRDSDPSTEYEDNGN